MPLYVLRKVIFPLRGRRVEIPVKLYNLVGEHFCLIEWQMHAEVLLVDLLKLLYVFST